LRFDESGLPKPGRELDAWIWVNVLGNNLLPWEPGVDVECPYCLIPMYKTDRRAWCSTCREWRYSPYQEYSTTHAYHSVMDAMEGWLFEFWEEDYGDEGHRLTANMYQGPTPADFICTTVYEAEVSMADYPDRERTYAHAVCAVVWKAMGGE
jgi:hypothetical protein